MPKSMNQEGGNYADQYQSGETLIVNNNYGITEARVREIVDEKIRREAVREFSAEAQDTAWERIGQFDAKLTKALAAADTLSTISDPAFQFMIKKAQQRAASTGAEEDHDLLTRLLVERSASNERPMHMVVHKAIEVVDQIDKDALSGLTNLWFGVAVLPTAGDMENGFKMLNNKARLLQSYPLPTQGRWLDRLDVLACIRLQHATPDGLNAWELFIQQKLPGYFSRDIREDEAFNLKRTLDAHITGAGGLVRPDVLSHRNFHICVSSPKIFREVVGKLNPEVSDRVIDSLESTLEGAGAFEVYPERVRKTLNYIEVNYPYLHTFRLWWNQVPTALTISPVGAAVAFSNAKRFDSLEGLGSLSEHLDR